MGKKGTKMEPKLAKMGQRWAKVGPRSVLIAIWAQGVSAPGWCQGFQSSYSLLSHTSSGLVLRSSLCSQHEWSLKQRLTNMTSDYVSPWLSLQRVNLENLFALACKEIKGKCKIPPMLPLTIFSNVLRLPRMVLEFPDWFLTFPLSFPERFPEVFSLTFPLQCP